MSVPKFSLKKKKDKFVPNISPVSFRTIKWNAKTLRLHRTWEIEKVEDHRSFSPLIHTFSYLFIALKHDQTLETHYFHFWFSKIYLDTLSISGISGIWISFISFWNFKINLDLKVWFALGGCCNFLKISDKLISSIPIIIQFIKLFVVIFCYFLL